MRPLNELFVLFIAILVVSSIILGLSVALVIFLFAKNRGQDRANPQTHNARGNRAPTRRFTEGITAMTIAFTFILSGVVSAIDLPRWSSIIIIPVGVLVYFIGLRWYKTS